LGGPWRGRSFLIILKIDIIRIGYRKEGINWGSGGTYIGGILGKGSFRRGGKIRWGNVGGTPP